MLFFACSPRHGRLHPKPLQDLPGAVQINRRILVSNVLEFSDRRLHFFNVCCEGTTFLEELLP